MKTANTLLDAYEMALKKAKQDNATVCIVDMGDGTYKVGSAATATYLYPSDELNKRWVYSWMSFSILADSAGSWRTA